MRIAVDAMGGDNAPRAIIEGAVLAARKLGVDIVLVGDEVRIREELARHSDVPASISVRHAAEVIAMDEHGAAAARNKRDASIPVAIRAVKTGEADAAVSAGNTGAMLAGGVLYLGRIRGIERPALGTVFPASGGRRVVLIDAGANAEVKPSYLVQFAEMGDAYARALLGLTRPSIGLLSIGEEASKGSSLIQETHALLQSHHRLNFAGNVEGKDLPRGTVDVVVTDGFTGNVALKLAEGVAGFITGELREILTSRLDYKLAALLLRPAFKQLRSRLDYQEYGGAPLLGVEGVVIVAHGRSDARAAFHAIRAARDAVRADVPQLIRSAVAASAVEAGA